jgi:hypothetical protein
MNTATTSPRPQRRRCAMQSWGVHRGLPAPGKGLRACRSFECHLLLVCFGGVTRLDRSAREAPLSATRSSGGIDGSARPGMLASEPRTLCERGEPNCLSVVRKGARSVLASAAERRDSRGRNPLARGWAGVRPRKNGGRCRVANPAGSRARALAAGGRGQGWRGRATLPGAVAGSGR